MGGIDWGQALLGGIAGGASAAKSELEDQQKDQDWLDREVKLQEMEAKQFKDRQLYMRGLEPPKTQTIHKAGQDGKVMDQQQNWVVGDDAKGNWQDVGDAVPNVNQERLDETNRHNTETEGLRSAADAARADANASRIDVARERLAAETARHSGTVTEPKPYTFTVNGKPTLRYGTFDSSGVFQPAKDETGQPIQGDKFRPSVFEEKRTASAEGVKGTLSTLAHTLGLSDLGDTIAGYAPSSAAPAQAAPGQQPTAQPQGGGTINGKRIVRTGTKNGQRVAQLEDGSVVPMQ